MAGSSRTKKPRSSPRRSPASRPAARTVHLMGNAHLDPAWLWPWHEGYTETIGLTGTALRGMEMFDDFTFIRSSAQAYEWVLEHDPELFEQVRRRVKEGRWDIVGGWWEQPDCNLPSAESFLRQGLYGQRFFQKHFGRMAKVGYCVDSFGHPVGLPALLRACGMEGYVFMRPSQKLRPDLKAMFRWVSPDGSSIIGIHIPNYGVWSKDLCATLRTDIEQRPESVPDFPYMYGFGDHGGGPSIEDIRQLMAIDAGDDEAAVRHGADPEELRRLREAMAQANVRKLTFSTYTKLIAKIRGHADELPVIESPAQHYAQGTYTSISAIKRLNRRLEADLYAAEAIVVAARQLRIDAGDYRSELDEAWKSLLFNQFHDLGAGSAFLPAMEDCVRHFEHGRYVAQRLTNRVAQRVFRAIDTSKFEFSSFFFNPLPWPVRTSLDVRWGPALFDEAGRPLPFQPIPAVSHRGGNEGRTTTVVTLPPCGGLLLYNTRTPRPSPEPQTGMLESDGPLADELLRMYEDVNPDALDPTVAAQVKRFKDSHDARLSNRGRSKGCWMENEHLRVEFDAQGRLSRLFHKGTGGELLSEPIAPVAVKDDRDAWGHAADEVMPLRFSQRLAAPKGQGAQFIESGPMRCTVATNFTWGRSAIRVEWSLSRHQDYLDAVVECDWLDRHAMIKLAVPTSLQKTTATVDTPLAPVTVPTEGVEEPCQKWMDLTGTLPNKRKPFGIALANDAKYGCSFEGSTLLLTALRAAHMGHMHYGGKLPPERAARYYQDQGVQYFRVRLIPHEGSWQDGQVQRRAMELNVPPVVIHGGTHDGHILADFSAVEVEPENALVLAVKPSEDKPAVTVVRLWESAGRATTAIVRVGVGTARVKLGAYELKTLLVTAKGRKLTVVETDALERPQRAK